MEIWGAVITLIIAMIAGIWVLVTYMHGLANSFRKELKEELSASEARWSASEARWSVLFEKFHILDKDMEKFKIESKLSNFLAN